MRAMVFDGSSATLHERDVPDPRPGPGQILLRDDPVRAERRESRARRTAARPPDRRGGTDDPLVIGWRLMQINRAGMSAAIM
ncbi:hypothetical protein [Paraburkholderia antibiotica]|uniref:Uncharacterized protein n=1 Tax=Paraburkholderia antibiotica TaxID=2728839 RepID=A0A7X9X6K8_9BURK|nr:hypothetical protein [Paraburkholderia antibiotica]NML31887.1 hypothetical protein [Paraburkholderia antibiotica]